MFFFLGGLLLLSCAPEDDEMTSLNLDPVYDTSSYTTVFKALTEMQGEYEGVWTIDDTAAKTLNTSLYIDYNRQTNLALYQLPFEAIVKRLFPGMILSKITDSAPLGISLKDEDLLWFQTVVAYGGEGANDCLESALNIPLNSVGNSKDAAYFELPAITGKAYRYWPIVVTPDNGDYFAMVLDFLPYSSTITFNVSAKTIACSLILKQAEIIDQRGNKTIMELKPELPLKYTSTKQVRSYQ